MINPYQLLQLDMEQKSVTKRNITTELKENPIIYMDNPPGPEARLKDVS